LPSSAASPVGCERTSHSGLLFSATSGPGG